MNDLFSSENGLEKLPIPNGELYYQRNFLNDIESAEALDHLINHTPWRAEKITVWGKTFLQPRLIAWYGEQGLDYTYSGIRLTSLPWTGPLQSLKRKIEKAVGTTFNSVLLNYYRDNHDSMGYHSDDEPELGPAPTIASLSLGQTRVFVLKHKTRKALKAIKLPLESGSLLLMKGSTQKNWKHGIDKESSHCGARINLTFRNILLKSV